MGSALVMDATISSAIPEPATGLLLLSGMVGVVAWSTPLVSSGLNCPEPCARFSDQTAIEPQ